MFTARFKPLSNQSDWSTACLFNDKATGTPITLTGITFTLQLQLIGSSRNNNSNSTGASLVGSTGSGELTLPSLGILQIFFPVTRIQVLQPGSYDVGLTMTNGIFTAQVIIGRLPIISGIIGSGTQSNPWGDYS